MNFYTCTAWSYAWTNIHSLNMALEHKKFAFFSLNLSCLLCPMLCLSPRYKSLHFGLKLVPLILKSLFSLSKFESWSWACFLFVNIHLCMLVFMFRFKCNRFRQSFNLCSQILHLYLKLSFFLGCHVWGLLFNKSSIIFFKVISFFLGHPRIRTSIVLMMLVSWWCYFDDLWYAFVILFCLVLLIYIPNCWTYMGFTP